MKNGKKPNKKQKIAMKEAKLNPSNWLVFKNLGNQLHLINRSTNKTRVISL